MSHHSLKLSLLSFLVLFTSNFLFAQETTLLQKKKSIDSILSSGKYKEAEKEVEALYTILSSNQDWNSTRLKAEVMYQRVAIKMKLQENKEAAKLCLILLEEAIDNDFQDIVYQCYLMMALSYELVNNFPYCQDNLKKAHEVYLQNNLDSLYSTYCIRSSSYYRFVDKRDSAIHFAYEGLKYSERYNNKKDLLDAYLLLGILLPNERYQESIQYTTLAINLYKKQKDSLSTNYLYNNIGNIYLRQKKYDSAFLYNDSSIAVAHIYNIPFMTLQFRLRSRLYELTGKDDSALYYYKKYHEHNIKYMEAMDGSELKNVIEQYENDKKAITIKRQTWGIVIILIVAASIAIISLLLYKKNRKIHAQNKQINMQMQQLEYIVNQKQLLLEELQHRVKNNLQQIVSLLEIQRESIKYNNLEETIRSNQNRIRSIAILYNMLSASGDVDIINLQEYIDEISKLVTNSYHIQDIDVKITNHSELKTLSIQLALPLGLILTELISNSLKYAFKNKTDGTIELIIKRDEKIHKNILHYSDNGIGFDFEASTNKGLGLEIIEGLVEQLNGSLQTKNENGFKAIIIF